MAIYNLLDVLRCVDPQEEAVGVVDYPRPVRKPSWRRVLGGKQIGEVWSKRVPNRWVYTGGFQKVYTHFKFDGKIDDQPAHFGIHFQTSCWENRPVSGRRFKSKWMTSELNVDEEITAFGPSLPSEAKSLVHRQWRWARICSWLHIFFDGFMVNQN